MALGAKLAGIDHDQRVCDLAVACELVHAATLLHDDVIDEGTERRGAEAARVVYGNSASILAGDYLLIEALSRVQHAGVPELLTTIMATIGQMVEAEALQLERRGRFEPDRASYMRVIEGKTASLFQWALSAGAILGGMGERDVEALSKAGLALGLVFQLVDDVLDLEGDPALTGKDMFADLLQGKLSWPLILATEADPGLSAEVRALCEDAAKGSVASERPRPSSSASSTRAPSKRHAPLPRSNDRTPCANCPPCPRA